MPWKNQGGGPWGSGPKGPWGSGPQPSGPRPPDLEDLLRRGQDRLQQLLPGGHFSAMGIALILVAALAIWGLSGFFRVQSEELGVVLRFGKHVRDRPAGPELSPAVSDRDRAAAQGAARLHHQCRHDADRRSGRGAAARMRDVPEESLMLTGDENIVDVDFTVLWRIKPDGVGNYLFNIQNPEGTVKAVAESAMREVIGRSNIQPILTGARTITEGGVQDLMQTTLDDYGAGVLVAAGADAEGRSAGTGDRRLPRRPGGARRPRAAAERGADLRQSRRSRTRAAVRRRSSRSPRATRSRRSPRPRARARASCKSTTNTGRPRK